METLTHSKEQLMKRIEELESERAELLRRTNAAIAAEQEKAYWLDRGRIDLNAIMEKPYAKFFYNVLKTARVCVRYFKTQLRRIKK